MQPGLLEKNYIAVTQRFFKPWKPKQSFVYWYPNPCIKWHSDISWQPAPQFTSPHHFANIHGKIFIATHPKFLDSVSASRTPAERLHKTIAFNLYVFALDVPWQPLRKVAFSWQNESFTFYHQVADLCYRNRKAKTCPRKSLSLL